ncbi:glycoside hydrolase [Auricularia subglabra TFB-10046 SS5]|nr:glycoside hydrolase [Auricularia subglabra TFB-10046 SS5]
MWFSGVPIVLSLAASAFARLLTIPTIPFQASQGSLSLSHLRSIVVDSRFADSVNKDGETLIPPTLQEFASTFASDLSKSVDLKLRLSTGTARRPGTIFLTVDKQTKFLDAAGRPTAEGYILSITADGVTIAGASPLGTWWGTRTFIQTAALSNGTVPAGAAVDAPGWGTRGVMLDAGRHYYPPDFLVEMCSYLSFFKQNTFHLHLSDNLGSVYRDNYDYMKDLYAAFRLDSDAPDVAGLNRRRNESYTRAVFDDIQRRCASRGVTIIPEIEAPGHALVITQWKPELALSTDYTMLNISHPSTIPTMKSIWATFLPWFHSKTVHIGADEYDSKLAADYNDFVIALNDFIRTTSSKRMRIWGTFPPSPSYTNNIPTTVGIQHWEFFEDNPLFDYIANNYSVLNSDDGFYIVNKWSGSYPQSLNRTRIFHGNPLDGGPFAPHVFDTRNATNNPPRSEPRVEGHVAALWNDFGPNATVYSEAYYAWRDNLPALADKQWGGDLRDAEYTAVFAALHATVPAQDLDRRIASRGPTILRYDFGKARGRVVRDASGNGYDGLLEGAGCKVDRGGALRLDGKCFVRTPLRSKGRDYALALSVRPESRAPGGALFTGPDSTLLAGYGGVTNVTLFAGGNAFALNYSLPLNEWTDVKLLGLGNQTFLEVGGTERMEFITKMGVLGNSFVWSRIAVEAPLARIGEGFKGQIKNVVLTDGSL